MSDGPKPLNENTPPMPLALGDDEDEGGFAAAMMRMSQPLADKHEADAEYAAAEALKQAAARAAPQAWAEDDMPLPLDYEGED